MRRVAVLFGGDSCENEISVLTGVFVMNVLCGEKYDVLPVYLHTDRKFYTSEKMKDLETFKRRGFSSFSRMFFDGGNAYILNAVKKKIKPLGKIDVALNCCHGGLGEGGGVAAVMELNGIPFASPKLTPSGVFLDKILTKTVAKGLGVPTVEYVGFTREEYEKRGPFLLKNVQSKLKYPVIVKPARLGSSIGISVAESEDGLKERLKEAFELDDRVLVERFLKGKKDVNCAAYQMDGEIYVSEAEEAANGDTVYGFNEKYLKKDGEKYGEKKLISGELREKIRTYTKTLYRRMDMDGVVRVDYLVVGEKVYLSEVNTVPGSLAYYLFCERISDAKIFFGDLLEEAIKKASGERKKLITTGILSAVDWKRK